MSKNTLSQARKSLEGIDFSFKDITDFDQHIEKSISGYKNLKQLLIPIATNFISENSNVYDLGCSSGRLLNELSIRHRGKNISFVGYDIESSIVDYDNLEKDVSIFIRDIADPDIKFFNTSLIFSIFTLQFLELSKKYSLIEKVYNSLRPGGAFIVAEKIYAENGVIQDILQFSAYDFKRIYFKDKDILDKQKVLRGIMRPQSAKINEELFTSVGFSIVESFWQSLNFKAWILIK